ncbi:MAG: hypothetical protein KDB80_11635 [Planctomycetes bacterium]|nr:hypothetical protein [Planctomycetota bacterium]
MSTDRTRVRPEGGTVRSTLSIAATDRAFDGHFPDNPAFPGVGQLWLGQIAAATQYGAAYPVGLRRVRFRAPVGPDTSLAIDLTPTGAEHELATEIWRLGGEESLVTDGTLLVSPSPRTGGPARVAPPTCDAPAQPDIESILPHRGPARFLSAALSIATEDSQPSWLLGRVPADNFLVADGRVTVFAALEFAAQAGPAVPELRKGPDGDVRRLAGLFAGIRSADFAAPSFAVDDELVAAVTASQRGPFMTVLAEVYTRHGGELHELATAAIKLLVNDA